MAVQLLFCGVLPPGLVQFSSQHSCIMAVKLFLQTFSKRPCSASYRNIDTIAPWKKLRFLYIKTFNMSPQGSNGRFVLNSIIDVLLQRLLSH